MKKKEKSIKIVLLTIVLTTLSFMGACMAKKVPTPEELWARHEEIIMEIKRSIHPSITHGNPEIYKRTK